MKRVSQNKRFYIVATVVLYLLIVGGTIQYDVAWVFDEEHKEKIIARRIGCIFEDNDLVKFGEELDEYGGYSVRSSVVFFLFQANWTVIVEEEPLLEDTALPGPIPIQ